MGEIARVLVIAPDAELAPLVQAVRDYHPHSYLVLLGQAPEAIQCEERWELEGSGARNLARRIRGGRFDRVYDFEGSWRTNMAFQLLRPRPPEWSGVAWGCSHPHANPRRRAMSPVDARREQLLMAGIRA